MGTPAGSTEIGGFLKPAVVGAHHVIKVLLRIDPRLFPGLCHVNRAKLRDVMVFWIAVKSLQGRVVKSQKIGAATAGKMEPEPRRASDGFLSHCRDPDWRILLLHWFRRGVHVF